MWLRRVSRIVEKNHNELAGLLLRKYPPFVWSDHARHTSDVPAFVFHAVTRAELEPLLRYLSENGYATLTADEYLARRSGGGQGQGRAREALLTFDDGHRSLYTAAYPLLERYGHKAVAYIVPGMAPEAGDAGAGDSQVCNWQELAEMHASGVVDLQSHSRYHHSIAVSDKVVDFVRPGLNLSFMQTDLVPLAERDGCVTGTHELEMGTPIHSWGARFGRLPAFREHPAVVEACVAHVRDNGGPGYFDAADRQAKLMAVVERARREAPPGRYESAAEQRRAILADLVTSKQEIERRLGKEVRHFCFPWFRGSRLAARLSAEAGYATDAWGGLLPQFANSDGLPVPMPRLPSLYIRRLPGKDRWPLRTLLRHRLGDILAGGQSNLYI